VHGKVVTEVLSHGEYEKLNRNHSTRSYLEFVDSWGNDFSTMDDAGGPCERPAARFICDPTGSAWHV